MKEFHITRIHNGISGEIEKAGPLLTKASVEDWLLGKNIPIPDNGILSFRDIAAWERTGAETYSAVFEVTTDVSRSLIIAKAIVTLMPEKSLSDWARRRNYLKLHAIPVSNWYSTSRATIYEDFYPYKAIENVDFNVLLRIGYQLDSLGFVTLKFIDDIRSDESGNPFYTDFGFDLGEPSGERTQCAKTNLKIKFPSKIREIDQFYEAQINLYDNSTNNR